MAHPCILVPFDGEPEAEEALDLACRLAREEAGSVQALYVARPTILLPCGHARRAARAYARIQAVAARHGIVLASRSIRGRRAGPAIVAAAANQDTVVLAMPRRGLGGLLSHERTWRYVARHASCRVLKISSSNISAGEGRGAGAMDVGSSLGGHGGITARHSQQRRRRLPRWMIALGAGLARVLSGLVLLLLAAGLSRGVRVAWLLALALLAGATLGARHDAWALATLLPAAALWAQRAAFTAPSRRPWSSGAILLAGLALLLLPGLGGLAGPGGHRAGLAHAHGFPFVHVAHAATSTHTHSTFARRHPQPMGGWPLYSIQYSVAGTLRRMDRV